MPTLCFRNIHTEDANTEQSKLLQELTDINKGEKPIEKKSSKKTFDFSLMQVKNIIFYTPKQTKPLRYLNPKFLHLNQMKTLRMKLEMLKKEK